MEEVPVLFQIFGKDVDVYTVFIWAAVLMGLIMFFASAGKTKRSAAVLTGVLAIPLGLLSARLVYVLLQSDMIGFDSFFRAADPEENVWGGANGAALWGAVGGVALAAWLAAKLTGAGTADLMDALAPGAALTIAVSRFGEYFIGEGSGPDAEPVWTHFFPLAAQFREGEWQYAVFFLEGITALAIFTILLIRRGSLTPGYTARLFLILYSSSQIILEQLRYGDNYLLLLFFFLRFSQVAAVFVMLGMMICAMRRRAKRAPDKRTPKKTNVICFIIFFALTGVCVALEYAMDKAGFLPNWLLYILELACCAGYGAVCGRVVMKN